MTSRLKKTLDTPPIACSLTSADLKAQAGSWLQLAATALSERAETADGLRLGFSRDPGVEDELRRLVAVERECCPWATWTVRPSAEHVVLEICSTGEGVGALHSMFSALQRAVR